MHTSRGETVYLVSGARTPIGSLLGALASVPATRLGSIAVQEALTRSRLTPGQVGAVYMGQVLSAAQGQAPARQAALGAGLPASVPCTTVNKVCASGMKAILLAAQDIRLAEIQVAVAGGMENMSRVPYYLTHAREGYRLGHAPLEDGILLDGLWDPYNDFHMGTAAEACAGKYRLDRAAQDAYAVESYRRVEEAYRLGYLPQELVGVAIEGKQGRLVDRDEEPSRVRFDKIPQLKPAFQQDGTITAANASKISDGAAAVVLAGESAVQEHGLQPMARLLGYADAAQDPAWYTTTPMLAIRKALERSGLQLEDIDLFEINEAFSCVPMANALELGIPAHRLNVWGGAVSLGHPIGCSGARIVLSLMYQLQLLDKKLGLAAICNGGGGASCLILERVKAR